MLAMAEIELKAIPASLSSQPVKRTRKLLHSWNT